MKAFWFGVGRKEVLLQKVTRDVSGGEPDLFALDSLTGQVMWTRSGQFIQDVDSSRTRLLTSTWNWKEGADRSDAVPRQILFEGSRGSSRRLMGTGVTCYGACYVRTNLPMPAAPSSETGAPKLFQSRQSGDLIFAAETFGENVGSVYSNGPSHLYRMHSDGTGLVRITAADAHDLLPSLDKDRGHILFWRSKKRWQGPFRLYRSDLDGSHVRSLGFSANGYPSEGLARAVLYDRRVRIVREGGRFGASYSFFGPHGAKIASHEDALFSPSGRRAIIRGEKRNLLVDLRTGVTRTIDAKWLTPSWIDDATMVAFRPLRQDKDGDPSAGEIAYLDLRGRPVLKSPTTFSADEFDPGSPEFINGAMQTYRLGSRYTFLWQAHHYMSDGGYHYIYRVDAKSGKTVVVGNEGLEAISPDSHALLTSEEEWVGGYKGDGAAKLSTLHLVDARTLNRRPLGPRRMICNGACFVPRG